VVTFASEAVCMQDRWTLVLTALYCDPATGLEGVAVLAGWDGAAWRPSAFSLLTNLRCDWRALPPPPEMTAADRGSVLLLHPVCTGAEVARAYAAFLELSGGHPAGRWLAEGG
jgi:hypothetical protein